MELLLIRHALPVRRENVDGPADPMLSEVGHAQARRLADYLSSETLHALYTSPQTRAVQTAAPIGERSGLDVQLEDGVAEYDRHADWYVPAEELKAAGDPRWRGILDGTLTFDGITPEEFQTEVVTTVERLIGAHRGQKIAVVCHGGVINAYLAHVLGLVDAGAGFFYPNYTSINRVVAASSGERTIVTINETAHLRGTGLPMGIHG
jgi:2,3-bisphosphoglycerate-dependent phosphoglycerate mutase